MPRYAAPNALPPLPAMGPGLQLVLTVLAAIVLSGMVFSGLLVFRHSDYDDLMARGQHLVTEGKVARAATIYERVLKQYGKSYPVYLALGKAYLAMNEPERAKKVLEAALALKPNDGGLEALMVKSQLLVIEKDYAAATELLSTRLETVTKEMPSWQLLRQALADGYTGWGDNLRQAGKLDEALTKYKQALTVAGSYNQEQAIEKDIADVALQLSEQYVVDKNQKGLIAALTPILEITAEPTLMVRLADAYQETGELDKAITWYRRAYDAEPETIQVKLSQVMLLRGQELLNKGKTKEAAPYFAEAESLLTTTISEDEAMATLYPVDVSDFQVIPNLNRAALLLQPSAKITVKSESYKPIEDLRVRFLVRSESAVLAETVTQLATAKKPLAAMGSKGDARSTTVGVPKAINLSSSKDQVLALQVAVAYGSSGHWHTKAVQQLKIQAPTAPTPDTADDSTPAEPGQKHHSFVDGQTH